MLQLSRRGSFEPGRSSSLPLRNTHPLFGGALVPCCRYELFFEINQFLDLNEEPSVDLR